MQIGPRHSSRFLQQFLESFPKPLQFGFPIRRRLNLLLLPDEPFPPLPGNLHAEVSINEKRGRGRQPQPASFRWPQQGRAVLQSNAERALIRRDRDDLESLPDEPFECSPLPASQFHHQLGPRERF